MLGPCSPKAYEIRLAIIPRLMPANAWWSRLSAISRSVRMA